MDAVLKRLMSHKHLGAILFTEDLTISETVNLDKTILHVIKAPFPGKNLLDIFPEFFGNEDQIAAVLNRTAYDLRLSYVNRIDDNGGRHFLDLLILPDQAPDRGILLGEDVTEQARMRQELNQQKYDLLLYQNAVGRRRRILSQSILGDSAPIRQLRQLIQKVSRVPNATVLLQGETGTGKSMAAQMIHYASMSSEAPLVDINCAALPDNLIESELFGYEKGAFTDALTSRPGLFEEASGGTVFLDEIGELPPALQAKLLSVIETKKFRRLGSNKTVQVRARIIAATNRNLQEEVAARRFREDLFYRLNVVAITLPPLRSLGNDILAIAEHFLKLYSVEFKKQVAGFSPAARQLLLDYGWPGNVRELSNCLERAMIFAERDRLEADDLVLLRPPGAGAEAAWHVPDGGINLEDVERQLIESAMGQSRGNKSEAARLLGLSRDTLRYRLEKYQLV